MKEIYKQIYLHFRKYILYFLSIFLHSNTVTAEKLPDEVKKALFIRIDRIGDLVLSTPALRAFKHHFPDSELSVLANKSNRPILLNLPYVDNIITYEHDQKIIKKISTLRRLRKYSYDLVIDPYSDYELKTALIAAYSRAPIRLGYPSYGREVFFNVIAANPKNDQHFKDVVLNVLKPLGVEGVTSTPEIRLSEAEKEWSLKWIEENQIGSKPIVGIHPGGFYETQRWPVEHYATILRMLLDNNLQVILLGGPADKELVFEIAGLGDRMPLISVSSDLRKTIALMSRLKLIVCNNSGPLHIAAALGLPTVSFLGPTNCARWKPIAKQHTVLKVDGLKCLGCQQGKCPKGSVECMRLILPEEAFNAIIKMLNSR